MAHACADTVACALAYRQEHEEDDDREARKVAGATGELGRLGEHRPEGPHELDVLDLVGHRQRRVLGEAKVLKQSREVRHVSTKVVRLRRVLMPSEARRHVRRAQRTQLSAPGIDIRAAHRRRSELCGLAIQEADGGGAVVEV